MKRAFDESNLDGGTTDADLDAERARRALEQKETNRKVAAVEAQYRKSGLVKQVAYDKYGQKVIWWVRADLAGCNGGQTE